MATTWFEQGVEKGVEKGQRQLLQSQLEEQFGPLSEHVRRRLQSWPVEALEGLGVALLRAKSLKDLGLED